MVERLSVLHPSNLLLLKINSKGTKKLSSLLYTWVEENVKTDIIEVSESFQILCEGLANLELVCCLF
jgi:hypothetical protein